jgi:hypothetical protein
MVMTPVLSVTLECNHRWHLRKFLSKIAIANGFLIRSFPQEIKFYNKEGQRVKRKVEVNNALVGEQIRGLV